MIVNRTAALGRWTTAPLYRTIDEERIVDLLLVSGWAADISAGDDGRWRRRAEVVLARFVRLGLPWRHIDGGRLFDPVEVIQFAKAMGLSGQDEFWLERCVASERARYRAFAADVGPNGRPAPMRVSALLERSFQLARSDQHVTRLRLPLPVEDGEIRAVSVDIVETGGLDWRVVPEGQRIEAKTRSTGDMLSVAVRYEFTWTPGSLASVDDDLRPYLEPSEGPVQVTPKVRATARRLAEGQHSSLAKVRLFRNVMLDELICGPVHYDQAWPDHAVTDWVLSTGRFDCHTGAALLVALCRAESIPARIVTGHTLHPELSVYHSWCEVWLDGAWLPYDLFAWDLSAAGRDHAWRDTFAGVLEPRMKTQSFPLRFTGPVGVPWPRRWHMLTRRAGQATETSFVDVDTGALVYRDRLEITLNRPSAPREPA